LNEGGKPASEIVMQLDVKRTLLYRWRDELDGKGGQAFTACPGIPVKMVLRGLVIWMAVI